MSMEKGGNQAAYQLQHVSIPFDQIQMFKDPQKNQIFLIQTLLLSTKITLHTFGNKYSTFLIMTKYNIWFKDEKKCKNVFALPINKIQQLVKAKGYPEILIKTSNSYDNVRISATSQIRCFNIISALTYVFTRIYKVPQLLTVYFINAQNLKNYQCTFQQKIKTNSSRINQLLEKSHFQRYSYKQPLKKDFIYGDFNLQNKRVCLIKQIYNEAAHMIHIAKIISLIGKQSNSDPNDQKLFYLHTIQKNQTYIKQIRDYQPLPNEITAILCFARQLDFKIQLYFEYFPQIPKQGSLNIQFLISPERLFINLLQFYNVLLQQSAKTVLDLSLVCLQQLKSIKTQQYSSIKTQQSQSLKTQQSQSLKTQQSSLIKNKRSFNLQQNRQSFSVQQDKQSLTQFLIKLRQFRFEFLLIQNDMKRLIYQCYWDKYQNKMIYEPNSWKNKFYHLSLIMYQFLYGKCYFSSDQSPQSIIDMKMSKDIHFPQYLNPSSNQLISYQLFDFMQKCLKLKFKSLDEVYDHNWMKQNVLILGGDHLITALKDQDDKKTNATKSF